MTKKHTPLPWAKNHRDEIVHETSPILIVKRFECDNYEEMQENAAFIVRACNSHYELLEALKEAVELITKEYCSHYPAPCSAETEFCYAQKQYAAIAKAEAETP